MKKLGSLLLVTALLASASEGDSLRILTWEQYMSPDVVSEFEAKTGHSLEFVYFEHDEIRDQIMVESLGLGFDLILVDDQKLAAYIAQDWIAPFEMPEISNYDPRWKEWFPSSVGYGYPYGYGSYGIAYRTDLIDNPPTHWRDLFDPNTNYASDIQMPGQLIELLMIAGLSEGDPANLYEPDNLRRARELLIEQSRRGVTYKTLAVDEDNLLLNGKVKVAVSYNIEVLNLQDESDFIGFIAPVEQNIVWGDFFTISQRSNQKQLALEFLKYIAQPEVDAQNVDYNYMATFNTEALKLVDAELLENEVVFPRIAEEVHVLKDPTREARRTLMHLQSELDILLK